MSRQLWWGHRIPVWYVHPTQKAADEAAQGPSRGRTGEYVVARSEAEAREKAKKQFGEAAGLAQEEDVLARAPSRPRSSPSCGALCLRGKRRRRAAASMLILPRAASPP